MKKPIAYFLIFFILILICFQVSRELFSDGPTTARGDLNGDGISDIASIIIEPSEGSGTFYYVHAALGKKGDYEEAGKVFIGDRIIPEKIQIKNGEIIFTYKDRKITESMVVTPTVKVELILKIVDGQLLMVEKN